MNTNKIKRAVLHIGPDKTGSTAIQRTFSDNSEFFESFGVISFQPNLILDADSYVLLQSLVRIQQGTDASPVEFNERFSRYRTHAGPALKLSPIEALMVLFYSRKHFSYVMRTFGVEPNKRFSRHVGFSICRHLAHEVEAQTIVVNGPFSEKPGVLLRFLRIAGALLHDVLLFPVCCISMTVRKDAG